MGLQAYRQKRKFDLTTEPRGRQGRRKGDLFVVQKHAATRLHYDFRLELDGTLKSWAVAKGPSLVPGEKRLAIQVEDHPLEYGGFEGTIPEGQYGAGTVMLWDRGRWTPEGDPHAAYKKGNLTFSLDGEKLKGHWHLVRMRRRRNERQQGWLLIKGDDAAARKANEPDILDEKTLSVATRRSLDEIAAGTKPKIRSQVKAAAVWQSVARSERGAGTPRRPAPGHRQDMGASAARREARARVPDFIEPCLALLQAKPPEDGGWVHEIKFDGYRIQARLENGDVRLKTRKGLDWTGKFPPVADAVANLPAAGVLLDGEIVAVDAQGRSDFSILQGDLKAGRADRFVYYVFDLLHLDGANLAGAPLIERKAALERLCKPDDSIVRYSAHLEEPGSVVIKQACRMTLEGIVSKRRDAPYRSGRTGDWVKSKCADRQEFVIGGYSPSTAAPGAIGALAMGYFEGGKLRYAGRVGTGYTRDVASDLYRRLERLRTDQAAFDVIPAEERRRRGVRWVKPKLVAEVDFRGWTGTHMLRHAAFKALREDKDAREVVREEPHMSPSQSRTATRAGEPAIRPAGRATRTAGSRKPATTPVEVAGVRLTHPDRMYWDDSGITKRDLAQFYSEIWDWIAPHLVRRPLALLRCPDGAGENCFVQKHSHATFDRGRILSVDDDGEEIIAIDDLAGLIALVQAGVLEVHVWGTTIDRLDTCDRLVFDLDPGPGVAWGGVIAAAREVRERLEAFGLESFIKTSGGNGLHVVAPIAGAPWGLAKDFAHRIALEMTADAPDTYVAKMTKSLRQGRIFVDYLRNGRGATAVAAYSSRARAGAPVSTPVAWSELKPSLTADRFTLLNVRQRLSRLRSDPWADIGKLKPSLPEPKAMKRR